MKIFVTGGSRGLGRSIVMNALAKGHDVAFTYNNPATPVDALLAEAAQASATATCRAYRLDVRDAGMVSDVVDAVLDDFGDIQMGAPRHLVNVPAVLGQFMHLGWPSIVCQAAS